MNVITRLEHKITYNGVAVQHFSLYAVKTPPLELGSSRIMLVKGNLMIKINIISSKNEI